MTKVLVIGLDGGTWNIIKPLVKDGKLPTIARLMKNGCYGDLESSIPFVTFPAWKCYSTGKNPGKSGVYWFISPNIEKEKFEIHNSTSFKSKELWDYLGENNIVSCVIDMPTTYPPKKIKGAMISNGAPRGSNYTYPEELGEELESKFNYKIDPDYYFNVDKDLAIVDNTRIIKQRFDVAKYLFKKINPSFLHVTICPIDHAQHTCWRYMEEDHPKYGKVIEDFLVLVDNGIKSLLDEFSDEKGYVFLMSDHGFTSVKAIFQISKWLEEKGYLTLKKQKSRFENILNRLNLTRDRILSTLGKTKIYSLLINIVPKEILKSIGKIFPSETTEKNPLRGVIDWKKSKIIPVPQGLLYINEKLFDSHLEYEKFRDTLIKEIKEIKNTENGEKLAKEVYKKEKLYKGEYINSAPDIVIIPNEGYEIACSPSSKGKWGVTHMWSGTHKRQGIFIAHGPGIKNGVEIRDIKIYDIAPTILHLFNIPIPKSVDGRVLKEIFEEDSSLFKKEAEEYMDERYRLKRKIEVLKKVGKI